ncbi:hypothetical protein B0A52_02237 [Exophiala mesophila]|uniref:2'-phosphotransferase n=1 Tax=Exophiala mesophila TaxID=212818 RepID=A0A438NBS9_EXOME|nr:hypothetical protein B0A52_02237 [Exophiala mesophila]
MSQQDASTNAGGHHRDLNKDRHSRGQGKGANRGHGRDRGSNKGQPRTVQISKAMSRLLRHAAIEEKIPIDQQGYVRMDHLLNWQRLRSMTPPVSFQDVVDVVQESDKKRYGLKHVGATPTDQDGNPSSSKPAATPSESESTSETEKAIAVFRSPVGMGDATPSHFFIRATQGHSMKTVEAENLLTPISLDDPSSVPETVVHGTFYGAWRPILTTGGLKSMTRNHVHFATGPTIETVMKKIRRLNAAEGDDLPQSIDQAQSQSQDKGQEQEQEQEQALASELDQNKVISGMRSDAQILIYIDIRKALQDGAAKGIKWWRSENGVILTDGISIMNDDQSDGQLNKIVPMAYWSEVVEIKEGLGTLWRQGQGVVQELPDRLSSRAVPRGKAGGYRGRGGRGSGRGKRG